MTSNIVRFAEREPVVYRWIGPPRPPGRYLTKILLTVTHHRHEFRIVTFYITIAKEDV